MQPTLLNLQTLMPQQAQMQVQHQAPPSPASFPQLFVSNIGQKATELELTNEFAK